MGAEREGVSLSYGASSAPATPPAAWYPDPADAARERWWDGQGWTDHVRLRTVAPTVPIAPPAPIATVAYQPMGSWHAEYQQSPYSPGNSYAGSPNTVAIWLLAAGYVPLALASNFVSQVLAITATRAASFAPTAIALALAWGLVIWDHLTLKNRGLPAASWAWFFLTIFGYLIARRVALKKGGIIHNAPSNVLGGMLLLLIVLSTFAALAAASR